MISIHPAPTPQTIALQTPGGVAFTALDSVDDRANDRVVVLLHGTGGSAQAHYGFLHPMLSNKQRVIAPSFSDDESDVLELDALVAQAIETLETVPRGKRVTLVGYSLGAVVAAAAAAQRPDRVDSLILVAGWGRTDAHQRLRNRILRDLRRADSATAARYFAFTAFSRSFLLSRAEEEIEAMVNSLPFSECGDRQIALNGRIDISEMLPRVACPTLVVGCTRDQMVPIEHSTWLWASIEDARFAEIESGHAVVVEKPAQLCALIQEFTEDPTRHPAGTRIRSHQP